MAITRVKADLALLSAGLIWGFGFVAQKTALDHIGPATFVALRFLISAIFVLPWVLREQAPKKLKAALSRKTTKEHNGIKLFCLCAAFALAVLLQQYGLTATSVTNTAFLTELYIIFVPFVGYLLYRHKLSWPIAAASLLSIIGIAMLTGGDLRHLQIGFNRGDALVTLGAVGFAFQVSIMGSLAKSIQLPLTISFLQYLFVAVIALILAMIFEPVDVSAVPQAWIAILYAGILSGGIAYTLQAMSQQHTPAADAAIIMGSEALFGGVGGVWLMHDHLTVFGVIGCCAILAAILLVEWTALQEWRRKRRGRKQSITPIVHP